MTISSAGIGSGLDVESIVTQLMQLERQPLNRLESKKSSYQTQLSDIGKLQSAMSTFQTAMGKLDTLSDFKLFTATSADESYYTASADSTAAKGTYNIQVLNLAKADKLGSVSYADTDTTAVGGGDLSLTVDGSSFTITGAGSMTLAALRDAINNDANNVGVTASIVSENSTTNYLVLTSNETGGDYAITSGGTTNLGLTHINVTGTPAGSTALNASQLAELDSQVKVDNTYTIQRSSNTITDAITGVTLNLKAVSASAINLAVENDVDGVKTVVQGFVDSFNELQGIITSLRNGNLKGDSSLLSIESQLRGVFNVPPSAITSSYSYLSEVGVAFEKTGKLALNATKLETAVAADYSGFAELFANDNQGYAYRLKAVADDILGVNGLIEARQDGVQTSIDSYTSRIEREEYRLVLVEKRLRSQYTALDGLLATLNSTSNFLAQQLASIQNISNR